MKKLITLILTTLTLSTVEATHHVAVFGDSITNGYPATANRSYCEFLQSMIEYDFKDIEIHKFAFNGATSNDLDYFVHDALTHVKPDIAIICLGLNDLAIDTPYNVLRDNFVRNINLLRGNFNHVIVGGVDATHILPTKANILFSLYLDLINTMQVDAWVMLSDDIVMNFTIDRIHPTDVGQIKIAESLYQKLLSMGL